MAIFWPYLFLGVFLIAAFTTLLSLPTVNNIGKKFGITDYPDPRKIHKVIIVRLGGGAIVFGFLLSLVCFYLIGGYQSLPVNAGDTLIIPIILASISFFILGLIDDIFVISYESRLLFQVITSIFIWGNGISIKALDLSIINVATPLLLNDYISLIVTVVWITGITNAINWIDGLDGLAAGIATIFSLGMIFIGLGNSQYLISLPLVALSGSCLAFLRHNFYPAKIMMGDGGSYFIGLIVATTSILLTTDELTILNPFIPFILILLPIFDMVYVIFNRIRKGLSPFYPDRTHLHHRLMNLGFSHKNTVLIIYCISIVAVLFGVSLVQN